MPIMLRDLCPSMSVVMRLVHSRFNSAQTQMGWLVPGYCGAVWRNVLLDLSALAKHSMQIHKDKAKESTLGLLNPEGSM